ncbi:MAG TPA: hypothetical protein VNI57_01420 [Candidatus Saccharimonadales bacterium]|nr:hypothetical protein [Candidatus Saccharimonadales bacterium]
MSDPVGTLTAEEELIVRVWRDAGPYSTLVLKKHAGKLAHGEVTVKLPELHAPGGELRDQLRDRDERLRGQSRLAGRNGA